MSGKSKHGKRRLSRSKRKRQVITAVTPEQPAAVQTPEPVPPPKISTPPVSAPSAVATSAASRYPYVASELRRIGILSGAILVILVILALVFS